MNAAAPDRMGGKVIIIIIIIIGEDRVSKQVNLLELQDDLTNVDYSY